MRSAECVGWFPPAPTPRPCPPQTAGLYASLYGLMNIFARSLGGQLSDWSNERFGMRGRIWSTWIVMSLEGVFCMLMATVGGRVGGR